MRNTSEPHAEGVGEGDLFENGHEVIVGHSRHIVGYDAWGGILFLIGWVHLLAEGLDAGRTLALVHVAEAGVEYGLEDVAYLVVLLHFTRIVVDMLVVPLLQYVQCMEHLGRESNIRLTKAIVDKVDNEIVDNLAVVVADDGGGFLGQLVAADKVEGDGVLDVAPHIGYNIRYAHDATFECHWFHVRRDARCGKALLIVVQQLLSCFVWVEIVAGTE